MEINDVIYGKFTLTEDAATIVKTNLFQRLKHIKQLSLLRFPKNDEHCRYHHCLGTYYCARLMLEALEKNTQWLKEENGIPTLYRKAIEIAALLHDIGHGPFSHVWENIFHHYQHESQGIICVDYIFKEIDQELFPELRANNNYGINLVKALILGDPNKFHLKNPKYKFIFEIIANQHLKLDIDKWDYLKRDYYYIKDLYQPENMDFDDIFLKARVSHCGSKLEYRYEDYEKMYYLCKVRYNFKLHCYESPQPSLSAAILRKALEDVKPKINNIFVSDITAQNMPEFLEFTDAKIMNLIESSVFSKFLRKEISFENDKDVFSPLLQLDIFLETPVKIPGVSKYLRNLSEIKFYGERQNLPQIKDTTVDIRRKIFGQFNLSGQTVCYYIQDE